MFSSALRSRRSFRVTAFTAAPSPRSIEGKRHTNPVVDGQLVPRVYGRNGKRRRDEPAAATPSPRARRPRRAVNYNVSEPDDDDDAPMRGKLIKWKLSGCTVAVTQVMVPDP